MGAAGTPLGNMVIKLGLDDADFGRGVANAKKQTKYFANEMKANMKIADLAGNQLGKLGARYDGLTKIIGAQEKQVSSLKKAYDESFVDGKATDSTKRLAAHLQDANGKLANYKKQLIDTAGAYAEFKVKNEGFTGAIYSGSQKLIKAGGAIQAFGKGVSNVGSQLTSKISLPIVAGFAAATKKAADFTTQIGEIGPLLTNGGKITAEYRQQLDQMGDSSKKWSKAYGISTTEINNGLAEIVRKGYDANQTMGVMPSILDATKASGEEFNDVMNVTTEVISQFGLKGKTYNETLQNTARVTDSLTYVANATSAGFSDLGLAMGYVGPVANSLGISVEETASAVGLLSDAGIGGEKAGTALRGALTRLLKPSKQNKDGFKQLGVSVEDFKNGSLTMPDILDKIKNNTEGWTDAQRTAAIALAFGTESQSAMNVLVGQGGDALRQLTKDTKGASGATKDIAKSMNDLPANKVARFKESLNVLAITVGEKLLPVVTPWIEKATDMVNKFSELDDATQQNTIKWGLLAAAAGPALKILGSGISIFGGVTKGIGMTGKATIDLIAAFSKRQAIKQTTAALAGMATKIEGVGTSAVAASGTKGVGALLGLLPKFTPWGLGIAAAVGIGTVAWKIFGEDMWNSSQRVQRWGSDVGDATDKALTKVQSYGQSAVAEFGLMDQGLSTNTTAISGNFQKMGQAIETEMTNRIKTLKELVNGLPEDIQDAAEKITADEIDQQEEYLETVQENNKKITQIKQTASNNNRKITLEETTQIKALANESAEAYVNSLGKSEKETQSILSAMTGNVENATEDQAKTWLVSLGKQRQSSGIEYQKMQDDLKKKLVDGGYDLNSKYAKEMLGLLKESSDTSTQITEDQMATILAKYPELAKEVFLANGQLISSMGDAGQAAVAQNKKMMETFGDMSSTAAKTAEENAKRLDLVADEANQFGEYWNGLVLDDKTGKVKTNAQEEVTKAAKSEAGWNQLLWASKNADLSSNAKLMIAEAGIANGKWDKMSFTEQQALLKSNVAKEMTQAVQANGDWENLSFEQKKALIYSNTPETMAETMLNLGLWDEYQPQIKDLKAKNEQFLQTLSGSEEKIKNWGQVPVDVKEILGDNYDFLQKVYESDASFAAWKAIPDADKRLLADNTDFMLKLTSSKVTLDQWTTLPDVQKKMLADNTDLLNKVFASEENYNAWTVLPENIKHMLANNEDLLAKVRDGTLSLDSYKKNNPALKRLLGDSSNTKNAASSGESALNKYQRNNPAAKALKGNSQSTQTAAAQGGNALDKYKRNNPTSKYLKAQDNASGPAGNATRAVSEFRQQKDHKVTLTSVVKNVTQWITEKFSRDAKGTNYHPGGLALVNDQRGALYKELIQLPSGESFIPQSRNVMLDLPKGSKVLRAALTKKLMPNYADGVGIPENSKWVQNLKSFDQSENQNQTVVVNQTNYGPILDNIYDMLIKLVKKDSTLVMNGRTVSAIVTEEQRRNEKLQSRLGGRR